MDDQVAGYVTEYDVNGFRFVTVKGSGHMVSGCVWSHDEWVGVSNSRSKNLANSHCSFFGKKKKSATVMMLVFSVELYCEFFWEIEQLVKQVANMSGMLLPTHRCPSTAPSQPTLCLRGSLTTSLCRMNYENCLHT